MRSLLAATLVAAPLASAAAQTDAEIRQVLLSSAWCSFTYNKVSGASRTERAQFSPQGTLVVSSGAESYSSGRSGSVAGQSTGGATYFWKVERGDVHLSEDRFSWRAVGLEGKRNSNGSIILTADGKEYAQCR
jgi:hypothetical protein